MSIATPALTCPAPRSRRALLRWFRLCVARQRQRRELAGLNAARLRDLGIDRADVLAEAAKPFWRE